MLRQAFRSTAWTSTLELAPSYGNHDAGVCCRMFGGRVLASLGRAGEAREMGEEAIRLAAELQHPFTRALALYFVSAIFQVLSEPEEAERPPMRPSRSAGIMAFGWSNFGRR